MIPQDFVPVCNMFPPLRMRIFVIEPNAVISKQIAPMQVWILVAWNSFRWSVYRLKETSWTWTIMHNLVSFTLHVGRVKTIKLEHFWFFWIKQSFSPKNKRLAPWLLDFDHSGAVQFSIPSWINMIFVIFSDFQWFLVSLHDCSWIRIKFKSCLFKRSFDYCKVSSFRGSEWKLARVKNGLSHPQKSPNLTSLLDSGKVC